MPLAFLIIGAVLIITAIRDTHATLGGYIRDDLTGKGAGASFLVWIAAIGLVGALGMVPAMRTPAHLLIALIIVAMLISNKGIVQKAVDAVSSGVQGVTVTSDKSAPAAEPLPSDIPVKVTLSTGGGGGGGPLGDVANIAGSVAKVAAFAL